MSSTTTPATPAHIGRDVAWHGDVDEQQRPAGARRGSDPLPTLGGDHRRARRRCT